MGASEPATAPCERLEWDTEHFGLPIAQVADKSLTTQGAAAIDAWCRDQEIRCLYFLADPDDPETARIAAERGYRVVDTRVTVGHSMKGLEELWSTMSRPETMTVREANGAELGQLRQLAARSHHGSRFYFDGGFRRERCDALYEAWVERAFRDPDRTLHAAIVDGEPVGYMAFSPIGPDRIGRGELGAVDERHQRRGVGVALHLAMLRTLKARGAVAHRGQLSARNIPVIRLHERIGFLTEKVETWHHKWFA